jgi:hypothetical protein
MDSLSVAQLAIYTTLCIPAIYVLVKHRRASILGWIFLFVFCSLRLVAGAISMNNKSNGGASIVSNIGLSPLLLATVGILHEA